MYTSGGGDVSIEMSSRGEMNESRDTYKGTTTTVAVCK